jgi:S-DNA-T family DNA segregation ATPase FtsK/SpoIIIE
VVTTKGRPTASRSTSKSKASSRSGSGTTSRSKAQTSKGRASHAASRSGGRSGGRAAASRSAENGLFSDHAADLWAIGLATLGILLALALYGDAAGTVGHGVDVALGAVVGWVRFLLPPICLVVGVVIIVGRHRPEPVRTWIGVVLGLLAACGLAELAGGSPKADATNQALSDAGGWLGVAVGRPLASGVGTAGAVVILVAVAFVGIVLSTGVSLGALGRGLAAAMAALGRTFGSWWAGGRIDRDAVLDEPVGDAAPITVPVAGPPPVLPPSVLDDPRPLDETDTGEVPTVDPDEPPLTEPEPPRSAREAASSKRRGADDVVPAAAGPEAPVAVAGAWQLPPMKILSRSKEQRQDLRLLDQAGESLVSALAAHGVETRLVGRTVGPTVTRFELELGPGVKVARVTSLSKDIAYAMASPDVRILAPIPGKSAIGVEVPNRQRQLVSLGDILTSDEAHQATHPLEVALGRDIAGRAVLVNLAQMPHVLISGATGAGKSSCINSLITSILMRATPDQVRMILVDPKRVELGQYNDLPHLLTPVVVDPKKAANALSWAVKEMERRYDLLAEHGMRDITGYNEAFDHGDLGPLGGPSAAAQVAAIAAKVRAQRTNTDAEGEKGPYDAESAAGEVAPVPDDDAASDEGSPDDDDAASDEQRPERLPFVLVVVDELNDLMMVAARDVEESVVRIAQMARAVGIHLVLATQRPSVDVITGVIKANVPSRMAFSVSSLADSRVILDQPGAERLIGKGDMLVLTASSNIPRRLQGPWVSEDEVRQVVAFWRRQGRTPEPVVGIQGVDGGNGSSLSGDDDDDELLSTAMELVVRSQLGSTSMLQRKLRVGFARAGRLMDLLEQRGVVGPSEGSKARAVLMTPEELDSRPG